VDVAANFEPDIDGDGYGDVTQDACPESAAVHGTCSRPDTTRNGRAKKRVTTKIVLLKFGSPTPGATFTCRIDKQAARACSSPFLAQYKIGKHVVTISATDPATGLADLTPLVVRFKVVRPN